MLISWIFTYFIGKYFYDLAREFQRKAWPYTLLGVACFQGAQVLFGIIVFFVADQTGHHDIFRKDLRYLKLLAILAEHMVKYYNYRIWSDKRSGRACWVFSADAKPEFKANKTVIKSMDTWFDKNTWQVRARQYHLQHASLFLDFDIKIKVENVSIKGSTVPTQINYNGQFDLPLKKPEIVRFWLQLSDWKIPDPED